MTTGIVRKQTALVRVDSAVRRMDSRMERARQSFNEKVKRAQADYADACYRAVMEARGEHSGASPEIQTVSDPNLGEQLPA